jgi:hypothetical protein
MPRVQCEFCQKWMKSKRGLGNHLRQSEYCLQLKQRKEDIESSPNVRDDLKQSGDDTPQLKKRPYHLGMETPETHMEHSGTVAKIRRGLGMDSVHKMTLPESSDTEISRPKAHLESVECRQEAKDSMDWLPYRRVIGHEDYPMFGANGNSSSDEEDGKVAAKVSGVEDESTDDEDESSRSGSDSGSNNGEDMTDEDRQKWQIRRKQTALAFKDFATYSKQNVNGLNEIQSKAVKIMHKLIRKRAPLDTYEAVMRWHLLECGLLKKHESLGDCPQFITRQKLMKELRIRYHMQHQYAKPHTLVLPHCRSKIQVWKKYAQDNVLSLLTDPRWMDEDWLYVDDDPFAPPTENSPYIEDINTGEAHIETYKKLITDPTRQILVPVPLYIDGAVTGQFDKLQVVALKMSIGLLNRKARDKEYAWRNLGFVTNYAKEDHRGKKMFVESGHIAAHELYVSDSSDEDEVEVDEEDDKLADYHAILSVLLESLKELIADGMVVDINYKGKLHKNVELRFYVPFVKCDGDEADKLCASFRSRTKKIQQLCRYCQCPTDQTDNPKAKYPFKTEPMMKKLFEKREVEKLRKMSQSCIPNAFHDLRFGLHNDRGVHGACPFELLHAVLLGIFKYARDCLFQQLGESSASAKEFNALAQEIGRHLQKQSDRNKPRTKFAKGILKGKLMAKEYTGVMLVMAALLQTEEGKRMLTSATKKNFRQAGHLLDWVLLIETLIQWEAYLNLPQMDKNHLQRLKKKHRFLLFLLKKVGARKKGMGFKVMKFHAVLHLAQDIEMFGVPMVVDTGSNESHHKTTKIAAKLTQKDVKTFEQQTSNRLDDLQVLELALAELEGRPLWRYFDGYLDKIKAKPEKEFTTTGGMKFFVTEDKETKQIGFTVTTRMKGRDKVMQDNGLLHYINELQKKLSGWFVHIPICAEHNRSGQIFRSHPNFRGKGAWRDWVMINWSTGDAPAKIWGFIDLSELPTGVKIRLDTETVVQSGVWAIIENCNVKPTPEPKKGPKKGQLPPRASELFKKYILEAKSYQEDGTPGERKFYLVDVETFKNPLVVIPNIGTKCEFLMMTPRDRWSEDFKKWIHAVHKEDTEEMDD